MLHCLHDLEIAEQPLVVSRCWCYRSCFVVFGDEVQDVGIEVTQAHSWGTPAGEAQVLQAEEQADHAFDTYLEKVKVYEAKYPGEKARQAEELSTAQKAAIRNEIQRDEPSAEEAASAIVSADRLSHQ